MVIGYGNCLRGDDGVGCVVAARLASQVRQDGDVEVIAAHQLTPELAEPISRAEVAVFVDAACDDPVGTITTRPITPQTRRGRTFGHELTPQRLLGDARALYGRAPPAWQITVSGASWGYSERLSKRVRQAVPHVLHRIDVLLSANLPAHHCRAGAAAGA
jgi:hydrogenase maturation protease